MSYSKPNVTATIANDLIYYDVVASNLSTKTAEPQPLYFNQTRDIPFLTNPSEYQMSIVRFTLDTTNSIPVFIPLIQANQSNVNLTIYSVTLEYTAPSGNTYTQQTYVNFTPQDNNAPIPAAPSYTSSLTQDNSSGYYCVYSYQWWISLVNIAFANCFGDLNQLILDGEGALLDTVAPRLVWDIQEQKAVLYSPYEFYNSFYGDNQISIFMNASLFELFSTFPCIISKYNNVTDGKNFQIMTTFLIDPAIENFPTNNPNAILCIVTPQESSSLANWSPILSVVFTSVMLPISPEIVSKPLLYANGVIVENYGNNALTQQVITDFVSESGVYQPNIVYTPTAQFRYVQLNGTSPLTAMDFSVFYKIRTGELIPFKLSVGGSATMKILFEKKSKLVTVVSNADLIDNANANTIAKIPDSPQDLNGGTMRNRYSGGRRF